MSRDWAPVALAAFAATIWGVWWVPIRFLEGLGLHGAWAGIAMNGGAALAALAWLGISGERLRLGAHALIGAGLVGVAVSAYSTSLTQTGVVRAVLLFYLAPAWSKLIEWAFLGLPWRWTTTLALAAALAGAFLVLGGEVTGGVLNGGDVLAIVSGLAWAAGAAMVFAGGSANARALTAVTGIAAVLFALPFGIAAGWPSAGNGLVAGAGAGVLGGAAYVLPILIMTLWSAQRLAPATLTFLLTAEILSGVISGAIWSGEPFGAMQLVGSVLIVLAAMSEVLSGTRRQAAKMR